MWRFTVLLALAITVDAGLLRVPKIYNTVITSDANLEPSRAYPIVQPVLTVQPVVAAADPRGYYPVALGGLYPFFTGTNALYPAPVLYQQPSYGPAPVQRPVEPQQSAPAASAEAPQPPAQTQQLPQQPPPMPAADVLNHRQKNPEIPDVPPPPLPVSASKNS